MLFLFSPNTEVCFHVTENHTSSRSGHRVNPTFQFCVPSHSAGTSNYWYLISALPPCDLSHALSYSGINLKRMWPWLKSSANCTPDSILESVWGLSPLAHKLTGLSGGLMGMRLICGFRVESGHLHLQESSQDCGSCRRAPFRTRFFLRDREQSEPRLQEPQVFVSFSDISTQYNWDQFANLILKVFGPLLKIIMLFFTCTFKKCYIHTVLLDPHQHSLDTFLLLCHNF